MKINFIHIPKNGGTTIKKYSKNIIQYNPHSVNVLSPSLKNQFIIIRNPIERFISSVYYALQKYSNEPHIQYLLKKNIDTPEKWIDIWSNPSHTEYPHLMKEMKNFNKSHHINHKILEYNWTYSPQSFWIHHPTFIILMDNFDFEISLFFKKLGLSYTPSKHNSTFKQTHSPLSEKNIRFLKKFYENDFHLYEHYKKIHYRQRLHLTNNPL